MKTFDTDENNDMFLVNHSMAYALDIEAVAKVAENVLLTQRGELEYSTTRGIPWFETVFTSVRNLPAWAASMVSSLKKVSNVTGLTSFDYDAQGNLVEFVAKINTIYGETTVNV